MSRSTGQAPKSILRALSLPLDGSGTSFKSLHGGSGFAQTGHLTASVPCTSKDGNGVGGERHYFVKISSSTPASDIDLDGDVDPLPEEAAMFRGEFTSLNAIAEAVQDICPRAIAWGSFKDGDDHEELSTPQTDASSWFLVTEFLQLGGIGRRSALGSSSLAVRLGKLHSIPAPSPPTREEVQQAAKTDFRLNGPEGDGEDKTPQFGFPVPTFCGNVKQANQFRRSWADFYANQRLRTVLAEAEKRNHQDKALRNLVERAADEVVPRLLGDGHLGFDKKGKGTPVVPVIVHGDLWSGNTDVGKICRAPQEQDSCQDEEVGDVVYDPSSCYAHSEFELGIMQMFGGFSGQFYKDYHHIVPKTEPVEEYQDRIDLYELSVMRTALFLYS
ncbi:phosphotransferase family protein [Arthroderma uncinatum]|uniref:phosphotransferase family protein n=1 Tax=Arthroderma uncinatum TaxID=74035 RepID=UPI00144A8745|nr:phosphotransferase family protein [Arthroderma uncinatum]KAF3483520.1 phosphotransferase family protein [Arthroderma uncinatum]